MCEPFAFPTLHRAGHVLFGLQVFHVNMANHHPVSQQNNSPELFGAETFNILMGRHSEHSASMSSMFPPPAARSYMSASNVAQA